MGGSCVVTLSRLTRMRQLLLHAVLRVVYVPAHLAVVPGEAVTNGPVAAVDVIPAVRADAPLEDVLAAFGLGVYGF